MTSDITNTDRRGYRPPAPLPSVAELNIHVDTALAAAREARGDAAPPHFVTEQYRQVAAEMAHRWHGPLSDSWNIGRDNAAVGQSGVTAVDSEVLSLPSRMLAELPPPPRAAEARSAGVAVVPASHNLRLRSRARAVQPGAEDAHPHVPLPEAGEPT